MGRSFLIDTGADESVFPATPSDNSLPRATDLIAANGSSIRTFGKRSIRVSFSENFHATHSFWIASVDRPILGADFFAAHHLLIDMNNKRLLGPSGLVLPASSSWPASVCSLRLPTEGPYERILEKFPEPLTQNFSSEVMGRSRIPRKIDVYLSLIHI